MAAALALLEEAVELLGAVDVEDLSGDELHETIRRLGTVSTRLEAQMVRVVHRWDATLAWADNGSKAPGARLSRDVKVPKGDAQRLVRRGRALRSMPLTDAAYTAGELNGAHVDLIASCDRAWVNDSFADSEQKLVNFCRTNVFATAVEAVRMWQLYADRDVNNPDPDKSAKDCDKNSLSASESFQGRTFIDGNLDVIGGAIVRNELERLYEQLRLRDIRDGIERTPKQRRAAALVEMATRSATMPAGGQRPPAVDHHHDGRGALRMDVPDRRRRGDRTRTRAAVPVAGGDRADDLRPAKSQGRSLAANQLHRCDAQDHRTP